MDYRLTRPLGFISAVIFVVDSSNKERINEAHEELAKLIAEKRLKDALILVFANKQARFCPLI